MRKIVADLFIPLDSLIETAGQWMGPLPVFGRSFIHHRLFG